MWKKILAILPFFMILQGCSEVSDEGCYKSFEDIQKNQMNFDMYTNICKSEDKGIIQNNVFKRPVGDLDKEMALNPVFVANDMITQEEADLKNNRIIKKWEFWDINLESKKDIFNLAMMTGFMILLILNAVLKMKTSRNSGQEILDNVIRVGFTSSFYFAMLLLLVNTNEVERRYNLITTYAENTLHRIIYSNLLSVVPKQQTRLEDSSEIEAFNFEVSLDNIYTCLKNNKKAIAERDAMNGVEFTPEELNAYLNNFNVYLPQFELNQTGDKTIKVMTNTRSNYTSVGYVNFSRCGSISYPIKYYNKGFNDLMESVGFNQALIKAHDAKDISKGWESVEESYKTQYGLKNEEQRITLQSLFTAFSFEYKKSLEIGLYLFKDNKLIHKDSSNIINKFKSSESRYKKLNEALCLRDSQKTKDSIRMVNEFNSQKSLNIINLICVEADGEIKPANSTIYHEINDEADIEIAFNELSTESLELAAEDIKKRQTDYKAVADYFSSKIHELVDQEERLIELLNEGVHSSGELFKTFMTSTGVYQHWFKELRFISDISYASSYPFFMHNSLMDVDDAGFYTMESVDKFIPSMKEMPVGLTPNNTATMMVKQQFSTDFSDYNDGEKEIEDSTWSQIKKLGNSASIMSCHGVKNVEECEERLPYQNAMVFWDSTASNALAIGSTIYLTSIAVEFTGAIMEMITDQFFKNASAGMKKGKKKNKADIEIGVGSIAGLVAQGAGWLTSNIGVIGQKIGAAAMLMGGSMKIIVDLVVFIDHYAEIVTSLMKDLLSTILIAIIMTNLVSFNVSDFRGSLKKLLMQALEPVKITVYFTIIKFVVFLSMIVSINVLPVMNRKIVEAIAGELPDVIKDMMAFVATSFSSIIIIALTFFVLKSTTARLMATDSAQYLNSVANGVSSSIKESVAKFTIVNSVMNSNKKMKFKLRKDKKEKESYQGNPEDIE
ncbi:hypothetical protein [Vibrio harveyi]|uniref:hypothetical protein n=1 Tax=Vibrio harveyi TaxID=669 RepID=UPI002380B3D7|nr:hypothetical protein [Vibrio harveyi]